MEFLLSTRLLRRTVLHVAGKRWSVSSMHRARTDPADRMHAADARAEARRRSRSESVETGFCETAHDQRALPDRHAVSRLRRDIRGLADAMSTPRRAQNHRSCAYPQKHSAPECWSPRRAALAAERCLNPILECPVYMRFAVTSQSKLPCTRRRRAINEPEPNRSFSLLKLSRARFDGAFLHESTEPQLLSRRYNATSSAPSAISATPSQLSTVSFSPSRSAPKIATRTTLSLSIGATCEALPSLSARK